MVGSWGRRFRKTKLYDFAMALPLILWFGFGGWHDAQNILPHIRRVTAGAEDVIGAMQLIALVASAVFCGLLIAMLMMRTVPLARAAGVMPRFLAITGTFIGNGYLYLQPVALQLWLQTLVVALIIIAATLGAFVIFWLGRSFSVMAEARNLVTSGPFSVVRHPLYGAEVIGSVAMLIQYFGWAALGLFLAFVATQVARTVFEEQILSETFEDYRDYKSRTARFIPYIF